MLILFLTISYSLKVSIDQSEYNGDTYDSILSENSIDVSTIISISVIEGSFPLNSISSSYSSLKILEIPASSYSEGINDELFKDMISLTNVVINGATSIGTSSFEGCTNLESAQFDSCITINSKSFQSCTSLTGLIIPQVTTIGSYCFKGISIQTLSLNTLTSMSIDGYCFDSCTKLEIIQLDSIETLPKYAFNGCTSLHTITCSNVKTINNNCFTSCTNLATITFPNLEIIGDNVFSGIETIIEIDFPKVTSVGTSSFQDCKGLNKVVLNSCTTVGMTAFYGCVVLSVVEIPKLKTLYCCSFRNTNVENVEFLLLDTLNLCTIDGTNNVGGYFMDCQNLKSFKAPLAKYLRRNMFSGCTSLSELSMDEAISIDPNCFYNCIALNRLILPKVTSISKSLFSNYNNFIYLKFESVNSIGQSSFSSCNQLNTIECPKCVSIGSEAFINCVSLERIIFPKVVELGVSAFRNTGVINVELNSLTIMYGDNYDRGYQFYGCSKLTHVSMTSATYIKKSMFIYCSQLIYIDAPIVTSIGSYSFEGCSLLSNLTFPKIDSILDSSFTTDNNIIELNLPTLKTIGSETFYNCKGLKSIILEECTSIGSSAFSGCNDLENITLPKLTTLGVSAFQSTSVINVELNSLTTMYGDNYDRGYQFNSCSKLTHVSMTSATYIKKSMFIYCSQLIYINVPIVTSIGSYSFEGCSLLSNLTFPKIDSILDSSFTTDNNIIELNLPTLKTIGSETFYNCKGLKSIILEECTSIGSSAFAGCNDLENITLPKLTTLGVSAFQSTSVINVELNSLTTMYGDNYNRGYQFNSCSKLTHVSMTSATYIKRSMFIYCSQLIYIDVPIVTSIENSAFEGCSLLSNLTFPKIDCISDSSFTTDNNIIELNLPTLKTIGSETFYNCKGLKSIILEECTSIGSSAFAGCNDLENITLPKLTALGVSAFQSTSVINVELNSLTTMYGDNYNRGYQFNSCSKLTHVSMTSATYIKRSMFIYCSQLIYIDVPIVTSIENSAFEGCSLFSNLTFPKVSSISSSAFTGNNNIVKLNFSTLKTIGDSTFYSCQGLKSIYFEECTSISASAFANCYSLESIYLPRLASLGVSAFQSTGLIKIELNSLTEIRGDGYDSGYQFNGCSKLTHVTMKSATFIRRKMFINCGNLYYLEAPSAVSIEAESFAQCSSLTFVYLDSCNTMKTNSFTSCNNIKTLSLGSLSVWFGSIPYPNLLVNVSFPLATSIESGQFKDYQELVSCKLPKASIIKSSAFQNCVKLTELEIPNIVQFDGDYIFDNCPNLATLSIKTLVNVTETGPNLFTGCNRLEYILMPDIPPHTFHRDTFKGLTCKLLIPIDSLSIYDNDVSIDGDVQNDNKWCSVELKEFLFTKVTVDNITNEGIDIFSACKDLGLSLSEIKSLEIISGYITQEQMKLFKSTFSSLEELIIDESVSIEDEIIPSFFMNNHQQIKSIMINCAIRTIEESAFQECSKIELFICKNVKELKSNCFNGPTSLKSLTFDLVDSLIGSNFFSNNELLETIELPKLNSIDVSGYICKNSPLLKSIKLPEEPPICNSGTFLFDTSPDLIGISNEAAIKYDASDTIDNDMKFYSLKLTYVTITCLIDGVSMSGLSLKTIIPEGAEIIEIIEGEIFENDFQFPSSIVSLTIPEKVILHNIPRNCFLQYLNLKSVTILSNNSFTIGEQAFYGCSSLEDVRIDGAITLEGFSFKDCICLKSVDLNYVETLIGNNHFDGCLELISVSFNSLITVPSDSSMIFSKCLKFSVLKLPSKPPKTFNKNTFSSYQDQVTLSLPNENDYQTYDKDKSVEGDAEGDGLWCGLVLPSAIIHIRINELSNTIKGMKLSDCIIASGISPSLIKTLEITNGIIQIQSLIDQINNLLFLETLIVYRSVVCNGKINDGAFSGLKLVSISLPFIKDIPSNCFKDSVNLKKVVLNEATSLGDSAFMGCISLTEISLPINQLIGDSHFKGCSSLELISLTNLKIVDSSSMNIFEGCPLKSIYLPSNPPKTFHKNTFLNMNVIISGLTNSELMQYDLNVDVEDDKADDLKWCGIGLVQLYITVLVNEEKLIQSSDITSAIASSNIEKVTSIEIQQGMVKQTHLDELKILKIERFSIAETAVLESSIFSINQFKDITSLIQVKIMQNVSLMNNCFSGCTSLKSIEFLSVDIICASCFQNCLSLNIITIPGCIELRGDFIFAGCSALREIDLSSLKKVDNSASKIFDGCSQLIRIILPSKEPSAFHKDTFINCENVKLVLPNKDSYLVYDDESLVEDDVKEDFKWCGIKIDEEFLPPILIFNINNIEYRSRKLIKYKDSLNASSSSSFKLMEDKDLKELQLIGGLVDPTDLKESIQMTQTIEKFEAQIGTLSEILSGTFEGCNSLKEIVIHPEVIMGYNVLQNLPSLTTLSMDLLQTIRSDEFKGDDQLQSVSLPLLTTIPSSLFSGLTNLQTVNLETASMMLGSSFKDCTSLEEIQLPRMKMMSGDSHFQGCSQLKKIDLSKLTTVETESSLIFSNCNELNEIKFGLEPPSLFHPDIFKNAGKVPNIVIPAETGWKNYVPQSVLDEETNHYMWYGFDTGIEKIEEAPRPTCPYIENPDEAPRPTCPYIENPDEAPRPTCPLMYTQVIEYTVIYQTPEYNSEEITQSFELTITHVLRRSVSFSQSLTHSFVFIESYIDGILTQIPSDTFVYSYFPYIIRYYSQTSSPTYYIIQKNIKKNRLTAEQLIGISCGGAAVFFIVLLCIIMFIRQHNCVEPFDYYDISDSTNDVNQPDNNINNNGVDEFNQNDKAVEIHSSDTEELNEFWF